VQLGCALHCDAVSVREGLLHILGGGVTKVMHPEYPAPLLTSFAVHLRLSPDAPGTYSYEVSVDGELLTTVPFVAVQT